MPRLVPPVGFGDRVTGGQLGNGSEICKQVGETFWPSRGGNVLALTGGNIMAPGGETFWPYLGETLWPWGGNLCGPRQISGRDRVRYPDRSDIVRLSDARWQELCDNGVGLEIRYLDTRRISEGVTGEDHKGRIP